ncbi:nicotinate (nicotinamide) nucleotide adenylyltransferase [Autumnicola psychrophila]|uniref:Probable nicotinate-nucleotide adenylyltransferase n=1 Tax=Autumnicola psychrophila TaxID=3075592 RepID=A0ABU3DNL5_9FLAO|nr:nicotinate (nicotinamide) nucleotide adenylyltransferase [Zunongwangia sp. F225]MDT0685291.1 nicotinate (nicotinamide) nucleotide adenylyltransferase [Zunongwangia sp. F225]
MNRKVGLFFGTFNPIHIGHLIIANHMAEFSDLEEIWLVVTPHNPLKKKSTLLDNHHRLEMAYRACEPFEKLKPSNIEFGLEQPNYTVKTLLHLQEKFPTNEFCLIMGEDNLKSFHKWKNFEMILENHQLYIYPRISGEKIQNQFKDHPKITRVAAPRMEISATFIRQAISEGKNIGPLLSDSVWEYIQHMNFYK